jgi:plastocyanin
VTTQPRRLAGFVLVLLAVLASACSSGNDTGDEGLLEFDQEQATKLGGSTSTTAAAAAANATTTIPTTAATQRSTATTAAVQQTTTTVAPEQAEVTIEVAINEQSPYFDPAVVQVLVGSKVRFTNKGANPHNVLSDTSAFDSGPIRPGGVWIYEANKVGRYNYSDGGRPFAVGSIQVVD